MIVIRRLSIIAFLASLFVGCVASPNNTNTTVVQTTPSPIASVSPTPASATETKASVQVTLPLLDALMSDEKFVGQLRQNLKLSDEQIESLKRASSAEIARLQDTNAEDTNGNATDARTRASDEVRKIIGDDKARQLAHVANDYWSKGDTSDASSDKSPAVEMLKGPNAVPTDTRVVVNIPAFRMDLFQNGSLIKSYKVGIGYPEFPLPFGLRKAQQIIFNPTWTPPDSPWVAKMKNVTAGETVKAGDKDNPLGPIKIPIGLPSLIHGGKSPAKIGKFASHGCVGLTNAQIKDFAGMLAKASNTTDVSDASIASYLEDREKTKTVKLSQTVPVELRYETIVLEDGKLHIYKDVYAQDTNTEENLRAVLEANGVRFEELPEQQRTEILNTLKDVKKETVIDISAVAKKGYPAPVNLDTGTADKRGSKPRIKS